MHLQWLFKVNSGGTLSSATLIPPWSAALSPLLDELFCVLLCINECTNKYNTGQLMCNLKCTLKCNLKSETSNSFSYFLELLISKSFICPYLDYGDIFYEKGLNVSFHQKIESILSNLIYCQAITGHIRSSS